MLVSLRSRRRLGLLLMVAVVSVVAVTPLATAAEGVPEDAAATEPTKVAYWNGDNSSYSQNVATSQFPPQAVCLVQPQACFFPEDDSPQGQLGGLGNTTVQGINEQEQTMLDLLEEQDNGSGDPPDPVAEGTLPVSVAFGLANYRSAIQFELPPLADGDQLDQFMVVLQEGQPTYASESPAFRQAVTAALTCASDNPESPIGRCNQSSFEEVANSCPESGTASPCLSDGKPLLVEACPITGEWVAGTGQDEDTLPEVDCLYSTVGQRIETDEAILWVFDLTFAASAWYGGVLPDNGILLRPGAAENFAYGDPETTYSKQVTFEGTPLVAAATSEAFVFVPPPPPPSEPEPFVAPASNDLFAIPSGPTPTTTTTTTVPTATAAEQPSVSEPTTEVPAVAGAAEEQLTTLAAGTPLGLPETPWWIWLLVPLFLAGAYLFATSLSGQVVVEAGRTGAMTRLLERQAVARQPDLIGR